MRRKRDLERRRRGDDGAFSRRRYWIIGRVGVVDMKMRER